MTDMEQLVLDTYPGHKSIQQRFEEFDRANPHVYARLRDMALDMRRRGRTRGSIELLFAGLRWEHWIRTDDPNSDFRLNDHYTSRFARKLMACEAELVGFFETRELRAA